jgi:hypothetical protein
MYTPAIVFDNREIVLYSRCCLTGKHREHGETRGLIMLEDVLNRGPRGLDDDEIDDEGYDLEDDDEFDDEFDELDDEFDDDYDDDDDLYDDDEDGF